jgi:hypothetical protein
LLEQIKAHYCSETGRGENALDFISGERKSTLQSLPRQMNYGTLKLAFNGDNAPGTVINSNVVHI